MHTFPVETSVPYLGLAFIIDLAKPNGGTLAPLFHLGKR